MSGDYTVGSGSFDFEFEGKTYNRTLNDDQYRALMLAGQEAGFSLSSIDMSQGQASLQDFHDGFAGLDIEFSYTASADLEDIQLGKDFDLGGKISDYAAAITDKFVQKTFLEPIMKSIIEDSKDFQKKLKEQKRY
ncbi:MAG: hypothetical protein L7U87_07200 [Chlamydiales bacterium]|nr:hypothetical protein [Chlamydiales bacterium]